MTAKRGGMAPCFGEAQREGIMRYGYRNDGIAM